MYFYIYSESAPGGFLKEFILLVATGTTPSFLTRIVATGTTPSFLTRIVAFVNIFLKLTKIELLFSQIDGWLTTPK